MLLYDTNFSLLPLKHNFLLIDAVNYGFSVGGVIEWSKIINLI